MSWMKIDHAPDHAGYDVFVDRVLVGRIPFDLTDERAAELKERASRVARGEDPRHVEVLNLRVVIVGESP